VNKKELMGQLYHNCGAVTWEKYVLFSELAWMVVGLTKEGSSSLTRTVILRQSVWCRPEQRHWVSMHVLF